jgi:hypothetical protein
MAKHRVSISFSLSDSGRVGLDYYDEHYTHMFHFDPVDGDLSEMLDKFELVLSAFGYVLDDKKLMLVDVKQCELDTSNVTTLR